MKKLIFLLISIIFIEAPAFAKDAIFTCKSYKEATISWKSSGMLKKQDLVIEPTVYNDSDSSQITFVVTEKKGILKGNGGQTDLLKMNENFFVEVAPVGNVFLWSIVIGDKETPTFIFQQKAYKLLGSPFSTLAAYKCE